MTATTAADGRPSALRTYSIRGSECIRCAACSSIATNNFSLPDEEEPAIVCKQPSNPTELDECEAARLACPTQAIDVNPATT